MVGERGVGGEGGGGVEWQSSLISFSGDDCPCTP